MDLLGLADDGLHVVIVSDGGLEGVGFFLAGLLCQLQLQGGKAFEAKLLRQAHHRRR